MVRLFTFRDYTVPEEDGGGEIEEARDADESFARLMRATADESRRLAWLSVSGMRSHRGV
jgi:hypothetical protein